MYSIISQSQAAVNPEFDLIRKFEKMFHINNLLRASNLKKEKGICAYTIFWLMVSMVFTGKKFFTWLETAVESGTDVGFKKDVVYRLLNSPTINWFSFLHKLALETILQFVKPLTNEKRRCVMIVDDTFMGRNRSKHVEYASIVHDHTDGKNKRGFRLLTLGFSDGVSFIPMMYRLLSSQKPQLRIDKIRKEPFHKNSLAMKRREDALTSAPDNLMSMLKNAVKSGVPAKHVLFDSWFSYPKALVSISKLDLFVVAMMKTKSKQKVIFEGIGANVAQIYSKIRKRPGKAKYLASVIVTIEDKDEGKIPARLVYVRDRTNKKKWLVLVATDMTLTEQEIIEMYGMRWDIEVFFKINKSFLRLTKEFQGQSFEMQNAQVVICFTRYIMMAVEQREQNDQRTMGLMFHFFCDELKGNDFARVLEQMLSILAEQLKDYLFLTKRQVDEFMDKFMDSLSAVFNTLKQFRVCET